MKHPYAFVAILPLALLAGCTSAPDDAADDVAVGPETPEETDLPGEDPEAVDPPETPPETPEGSGLLHEEPATIVETMYLSLDLRDVPFENTLKRLAIVAETDLEVKLDWNRDVSVYEMEDGCIAGAVQIPHIGDPGPTFVPGRIAAGPHDLSFLDAHHIDWVRHDGLAQDVYVQAAETVISQNPLGASSTSAGFSSTNLNGTYHVPAGSTILVSMGGTKPELIAGDDEGWVIDLELIGSATIEERPDAPIQCGVGPRQAMGGATLATGAASATAQSAVSVDATGGSTIIFRFTDDENMPPLNKLTFLGQDYEQRREFQKSAAEGGTIAVHFDAMPSRYTHETYWLIAGDHWPSITDVDSCGPALSCS